MSCSDRLIATEKKNYNIYGRRNKHKTWLSLLDLCQFNFVVVVGIAIIIDDLHNYCVRWCFNCVLCLLKSKSDIFLHIHDLAFGKKVKFYNSKDGSYAWPTRLAKNRIKSKLEFIPKQKNKKCGYERTVCEPVANRSTWKWSGIRHIPHSRDDSDMDCSKLIHSRTTHIQILFDGHHGKHFKTDCVPWHRLSMRMWKYSYPLAGGCIHSNRTDICSSDASDASEWVSGGGVA